MIKNKLFTKTFTLGAFILGLVLVYCANGLSVYAMQSVIYTNDFSTVLDSSNWLFENTYTDMSETVENQMLKLYNNDTGKGQAGSARLSLDSTALQNSKSVITFKFKQDKYVAYAPKTIFCLAYDGYNKATAATNSRELLRISSSGISYNKSSTDTITLVSVASAIGTETQASAWYTATITTDLTASSTTKSYELSIIKDDGTIILAPTSISFETGGKIVSGLAFRMLDAVGGTTTCTNTTYVDDIKFSNIIDDVPEPLPVLNSVELYNGSEKLSKITVGELSCDISLTVEDNNSLPCVIAAMYDDKHKLKHIETLHYVGDFSRQYSANITVDSLDDIIKIFVLGDLMSIKPIVPVTTINKYGITVDGNMNVNDFPTYKVFQRGVGDNHNTNIEVSGTFSAKNISKIQSRVVEHMTSNEIVPWTDITYNLTSHTFGGTLSVPQGGWYNIQVRGLNVLNDVIAGSEGANKWGIGMIILCAGQSNMVGQAVDKPFTVADDLVSNYNSISKKWEHKVDTIKGSLLPALGNELSRFYKIPVAFVQTAVSGTTLIAASPSDSNVNNYWGYRNEVNHADTTTLYGNSIARAREAGGVAEFIVWNQGETDAKNKHTVDEYKNSFQSLVNHYREDLNIQIPIVLCQIGKTSYAGIDQDYTNIRRAISEIDNGNDILMAATEMDLTRIDMWHYNVDSYNRIGERIANGIKYYLKDASYYRGPSILGAKFSLNLNTIDVSISHRGGTDFTPSSGITGFEVFNNDNPAAIQSIVRLNSTTVRITLATPASGTTTFRYLYGSDPNVTGIIKDNSDLMLPLEATLSPIMVDTTGL